MEKIRQILNWIDGMLTRIALAANYPMSLEEMRDSRFTIGEAQPYHYDDNGVELPYGVTRDMLSDGEWKGHGDDCPCFPCSPEGKERLRRMRDIPA